MSKYSLSALLVFGCVTLALAEDAKPARDTAPAKPKVSAAEQREEANTDRSLATCIAIGNQEEIALTQFAVEHIQNPEVKKFAQMLIDDHTKFGGKLTPYASEVANMPFDDAHAGVRHSNNKESKTADATAASKEELRAAKREARRKDDSDRQTVTSAHSGLFAQERMAVLERQVANECLTLAKRELTEAKESGDFDQAFLGCQVATHLNMIAKLTVFERESTGELAQVFGEGRASTEKHLEEAKHLMRSLKQSK